MHRSDHYKNGVFVRILSLHSYTPTSVSFIYVKVLNLFSVDAAFTLFRTGALKPRVLVLLIEQSAHYQETLHSQAANLA